MTGADDPEDRSPEARVERELRALLPATLAVAQSYDLDRQATARHVIKVVMLVVRPHLVDRPPS